MSGVSIGVAIGWVAIAVVTYVLAGAIGLCCTLLFNGVPCPLRDVHGFPEAFRVGIKASATWPWTWRRWTDG